MHTRLLIPHSFRRPGWVLLTIGLAMGIYTISADPDIWRIPVFSIGNSGIFSEKITSPFPFYITNNSIFNEVASLLIIFGGFFVGFSREKVEDEMTAQLRRESITWAIYLNYAILILAILLTYDINFYWVMVFNMFTVLLFHIIRFQFLLYRLKKLNHEE